MQVEVLNSIGANTGKQVELSDDIYQIEPNDHAIYLDVKQYLANQRQGTHKSKERAEIAGSTRKIKKQKGTGTARAGSKKSPVFVGGGRAFGPRPKDYSFKLNKKVKDLARKSALSHKAKNSEIIVVEDFSYETPRTKEYIKFLESLSVGGKKTLLLTADVSHNIYMSGRNLPKTAVMTYNELNTYHLLNVERLIIFETAVPKIQELFS